MTRPKSQPTSLARLALLLCLGILPACQHEAPVETAGSRSTGPVAELERIVRSLCAVKPARNAKHPEVLMAVAEQIGRELSRADGELRTADFKVDGRTYRNVSLLLGPETESRVVVGAHYDVAGELPGADDNASGVAALIELARRLDGAELGCRIELVCWPLEEPPYFGTREMGSAVHAAALKQANIDVRAMIALEMVGYFSDEPGSQQLPDDRMRALVPDTGNFIAVVGRQQDAALVTSMQTAMRGASTLPVIGLPLPASVPGLDLSDHRNYWAEGFPAVMVTDTAFFRNPNYHEPGDRPETLDYRRMNQVVEGLQAALITLAVAPSKD